MPDTKTQSLRYGKGRMSLKLPASATVLIGPQIPALPDPEYSVREALKDPIKAEALQQLASRVRPQTVVITISDVTRPVPNELLVSAILGELNAAGVPDSACTVLIATGMHLPSTPEERDVLLGPDLQRRVRVVDHESRKHDTLIKVTDDPPIYVNRLYADADLKIVTGLIEPHFMAGFSGGRKGVCPAIVDLATIQRFHGYATMADPNTVEGRLVANPCHEIATRVARRVGVDFLANVTITHDRCLAGVYAGDLEEAFLVGCRDSARWASAGFDEPFDLVVTCGGGFPLDTSFYQTVKGMCCALPALKPEGMLLTVAACDKVGDPEYVALYDRFGPDWRAFLEHIARNSETEKDQWEYQMQTRVLEHVGIERTILSNDGLPIETQRRIAVTPAPGEGDAQARAQALIDRYAADHPDARIAVIPEGPYTMLAESILTTA
jgi:nickel-dependent lactate racemase